MNTEQANGKLEHLKGKIKQTWNKLSDRDVMLYQTEHEKFFSKLQEHYGLTKQAAEIQVKILENACQCDPVRKTA